MRLYIGTEGSENKRDVAQAFWKLNPACQEAI